MTFDAFTPFFAAAAGAGAAFIGLLFIAVSIRPDQLVWGKVHPLVRASVGSTFTALINGFFISFASLIPGTNPGWVAFVLGITGVINALSSSGSLVRHLRGAGVTGGAWWLNVARWLTLSGLGLFVYLLEIWLGWQAIQHPTQIGPIFGIADIVLTVYGLGLVRAWELLGSRRTGILRFLSPLRDLDGLMAAPKATSTTIDHPSAPPQRASTPST
ncbi:MAG TPA: hypothetical protein VF807_15015 [Ktedonobacterales bacterium]